jgi:hypothetical protein
MLSPDNALSHQIRLALLSRRLPTIARIYDALHRWDVTEATAQEIIALCDPLQMSKNTIYTALKMVLNAQAPLFLKRPAAKRQGRPAALYITLTDKQLSSLLDVQGRDYYEMPLKHLLSNQTYRAAVYHFQIANHAGQYHRRDLAAMLGITPRTAQKLDAMSHVKAQAQYKPVQFDLTQLPTDARDLPGNYSLLVNGKHKAANRLSYLRAIKEGHTPQLMKRILNWYEIDYSNMVEDFFPEISDGISIKT